MAEKKEKSQVTKYFIQRIDEWVKSEMEKDHLFADQVKASGKTITQPTLFDNGD